MKYRVFIELCYSTVKTNLLRTVEAKYLLKIMLNKSHFFSIFIELF